MKYTKNITVNHQNETRDISISQDPTNCYISVHLRDLLIHNTLNLYRAISGIFPLDKPYGVRQSKMTKFLYGN